MLSCVLLHIYDKNGVWNLYGMRMETVWHAPCYRKFNKSAYSTA